MAKGSSTSVSNPRHGRCFDCVKGYVMSDGVKGNPLITECTVTHVRVSQSWICPEGCFVHRPGPLEIHPMIFLNRKTQ